MNLKEFLNKYTEENMQIDLIPGSNTLGELLIKIKFKNTIIPMKLAQGTYTKNPDNSYSVKLGQIIGQLKQAIQKENNNEAFMSALSLLSPDKIVQIYENKVEIYFNDQNVLSFR